MLVREKRKGGRGREGGLAAIHLSHLVPQYSPTLYSSSEKTRQAFTLDEGRKREREYSNQGKSERLVKARGEKEKSESV